ncbi:hypothetical protein TEA_004731 [Camellia sinensis var. sinensis]|uniref:Uncharacterized protein n=1 Tax=Camellia sinensis var. sinensis TaxID=542762 RepID=A0A4S4DM57_CAMSN|nr:hypothetical protein TEA_004731 [Camellia sinensis var. sinensis]
MYVTLSLSLRSSPSVSATAQIPSTQTHLPTEIEIEIELDWILKMGISKIEINLRRLLAAASHQQNQAKLIHYVATLREQLEQLAEERTSDGLPRVSKAQVNDYSEKIEALTAKLAALVVHSESVLPETLQPISVTSVKESPSKAVGESSIPTSPGLRRRFVAPSNIEDRPRDSVETDYSAPVKLDAAARTHIDKHRKLQDDLTDEMVGLAQQLKESSLMMSQSLQNTEKILDSTEQAVEQSLASTGRANIVEFSLALREAGCFSVVLECVLAPVAVAATFALRIPTIGPQFLHLNVEVNLYLLHPFLRSDCIIRVLTSGYTMDEPESSRHKEVNTEIDDQFALDGKDDVVDVKEGQAMLFSIFLLYTLHPKRWAEIVLHWDKGLLLRLGLCDNVN